MGRLTGDMARLVGEIQAARGERERLVRERRHGAQDLKRRVAVLREGFATDLRDARAVWLGRTARVSPRAGAPRTVAPGRRGSCR